MTNKLSNIETIKDIEILVVEDDCNLALNLQDILESLGYKVIDIAHSAEVAIEKAYQLHPNLILMNIRLSGEMDGIQAAEKIWNNLQIPIIYVTGFADKNTLDRARLTYPFAYLIKPVTKQELDVAIQTALNIYELEQFFKSILQGIAYGVIVVDYQLRIKYLNPEAEEVMGLCTEEVKGEILTEAIQFIDGQTQLPAQNQIILALKEESTIYIGESILLIARDSKKKLIADTISPLKNNQGKIIGYVMMFKDKTQRGSVVI